jgi:hypothetical protein
LGLIAQFALGGCAESVTTQNVKSPVQDRRTPVDASEPLLRSEWRVDSGRIVGHVSWSSCTHERSWSIDEQRVEHVRPMPAVALLLIAAGLGGVIVGSTTRSSEPTTTCMLVNGINSCTQELPDNNASNFAVIAGGLAIATAFAMLAIKPSDKVTVIKREPHAEKLVSACVTPAELNLLLKLGPNRFVHITVDADGQASADLPANARLPKGADLEVVVSRAPAAFSKTLPQWTAIGRVHVPE